MEFEHELAELILTRKGSHSDSDLADPSGLSRAAIHRLTKSPIHTVPDPETLRGLAAALDAPSTDAAAWWLIAGERRLRSRSGSRSARRNE